MHTAMYMPICMRARVALFLDIVYWRPGGKNMGESYWYRGMLAGPTVDD